MMDPVKIEASYKEFMTNLSEWAHDGILKIDLHVLHDLNLLDSMKEDHDDTDDLTQYFHVVESAEKVTLYNDQFLVWIVPKMDEQQPMTYVLIALCQQDHAPHLEIVFETSGIYNTPRYVLKILQHFLADVLETEQTLTSIAKNQ